MSFNIAVVSGKGGTGKTTISVQLALFLSQKEKRKVRLVDCDVEEPNDGLFFPDKKKMESKTIYQSIAEIDINKCRFCRDCVTYCNYNAIVVIPRVKFAQVEKTLCHSCGACIVACRHNAINEVPEPIGQVNSYQINSRLSLMEGELKIGSPMQTMLIKALKKEATNQNNLMILDAPPGTSCSVVETVSDAQMVIVVTEPTPFGLHDLKLTVELLRDMKKPFGVIVNKAGLGNNDLFKYLEEEKIPLIDSIPFSKEIAAKYASGELLNKLDEKMINLFSIWWNQLKETEAV